MTARAEATRAETNRGAASHPVRLETSGGSETVLFLHGGGVGGWCWTLQAEALPEFHCLAPDLPGHGLRQRNSRFTVRGGAEEAAALISARARGGKAHVVGLSLGAQVGLQLVADCPELVHQAFLSGPLVLPHWSTLRFTEPLLQPLNAALLGLYMPFRNLQPVIRANMRVANIPPRFEAPFRVDTNLRNVPALVGTLDEYARFRLPTRIAHNPVPTLLLVGSREPPIIRNSVTSVARVAPNTRACRVREAEHTWNLGHPGLFNAALRAWLLGSELPEALEPLGTGAEG